MPNLVVQSLPGVTVLAHTDQERAVATVDFAVGDEVLALGGSVRGVPTRYTLQVGIDEHLDAEAVHGGYRGVLAWRFADHSCAPVTRLVGRSLIAVAPIAAGEPVTFDYDTTEWDMASPFVCACGAAACRGVIRGYRHLSPVQRARLPFVALHLKAMLERTAGAVSPAEPQR